MIAGLGKLNHDLQQINCLMALFLPSIGVITFTQIYIASEINTSILMPYNYYGGMNTIPLHIYSSAIIKFKVSFICHLFTGKCPLI